MENLENKEILNLILQELKNNNNKIDKLEGRFDKLEGRFDKLENNFAAFRKETQENFLKIHGNIADIKEDIENLETEVKITQDGIIELRKDLKNNYVKKNNFYKISSAEDIDLK